ncbi:beta-glucosidase 13-like, partial [Prunus avium]|uniref:Beta-glucosidase 13-like n=1 Tax=Prunus avium TaxID=42229 RepID=A0A6P5REU6_PRUAV
NYFRDFADLCFREFGDKVKHWITMNKPWSYSNNGFVVGTFMDPVINGRYPHTMRHIVRHRLPEFTKAQSEMLKGSYDFIVVNYYATYYVTENGNFGYDDIDDPKLPLEEALIDNQRVDYYHRHLDYLNIAIKDGVNVKGYFAWSLFDNFKWDLGYTVKFGINYVDYKDGLKRYPKLSAC